jgi:hypothetical protein
MTSLKLPTPLTNVDEINIADRVHYECYSRKSGTWVEYPDWLELELRYLQTAEFRLKEATVSAHPAEHLDDFIDGPFTADPGVAYARWFLMNHRLPAILKMQFAKYIEPYKLFCRYRGKAYRVTGGSRLGDIWITRDFSRDIGYDARVSVTECSDWSETAPTKG